MRYEDANTECSHVAMGVFSLASIPVICSRGWSTNSVYCTLVGCVDDRKQGWSHCCGLTINKDKTVDIKWDHTSQFRRKGLSIGLSSTNLNLISIRTSLWEPNSLTGLATYIRQSALFHLRAGHESKHIKTKNGMVCL